MMMMHVVPYLHEWMFPDEFQNQHPSKIQNSKLGNFLFFECCCPLCHDVVKVDGVIANFKQPSTGSWEIKQRIVSES